MNLKCARIWWMEVAMVEERNEKDKSEREQGEERAGYGGSNILKKLIEREKK